MLYNYLQSLKAEGSPPLLFYSDIFLDKIGSV